MHLESLWIASPLHHQQILPRSHRQVQKTNIMRRSQQCHLDQSTWQGDGQDDDAKSKKASSSESESDSGSSSSGSGSGSGSGDSSPDFGQQSFREWGGRCQQRHARSDVVTKRKVRRKKKPHQSNEDSNEETVPKTTATKTGGHSDDDAKRTLQDSGVGEGATANPIDDGATADPIDDGAPILDCLISTQQRSVAIMLWTSGEQALFHFLPPCPPWLLWRR